MRCHVYSISLICVPNEKVLEKGRVFAGQYSVDPNRPLIFSHYPCKRPMEIILEAPHHPQKANEKGPSFGNT
jgi:hypothetical protein